jgi:hypothetical protein
VNLLSSSLLSCSLYHIRQQLETLLGEKAQLAHENTVYARENRFLREIVEIHQLNMQDVVNLDDDIEDDEDEEYIEEEEEDVSAEPKYDYQYDDPRASSPSHCMAEEDAEHFPLPDVLDAALPLPDVLETAPLSPSQQTEDRVLGANRDKGVIIGNDSPRMLGTNSGGNITSESPRMPSTHSGSAIEEDKMHRSFKGRWFIT